MKTRVSFAPVVFAAMSLVPLSPAFAAANSADIAPAAQRQAVNQQAAQLSAKPAAPATAKPAATPFSPSGFESPANEAPRVAPSDLKDAAPTKPMTPYEIIRAFAPTIQVKGTMMVSGVRSLTIKSADGGQIMAKVGGKITVPFQGATYEVRVTAIDATSYTIEWNGEKLTRPIGAGY